MNQIGVYGLGVMGKALATNLLNKGFQVGVYDRYPEVVEKVINERKEFHGSITIEEFVNSLEKPRKIIIMVTAGKPVDEVIEQLTPYLEEKDIVIDCGNSYYLDTEARQERLKGQFNFIGCGVSGGEEGALKGPSIMPSGDAEAYHQIKPYLTAIAAKNDDGTSCCDYVGNHGAGHFVKMVHNGIEYAEMQLIAEFYSLLKQEGYDNLEMSEVFAQLNQTELNSYLLDITKDILKYKEEGEFLIDKISDVAKQKGTGKWTSEVAISNNIAIPSLINAVEVRFLSELVEERKQATEIYRAAKKENISEKISLETLKDAMMYFRLSLNAQGFDLIAKVSDANHYNINLSNLANIWQNGCIIKSELIGNISKLLKDNKNSCLLLNEEYARLLIQTRDSAKEVLGKVLELNLYTPIMNSAYQHVLGYSTECLPTNLIQGQRDYFGAHTYQRIDKPGDFHTLWDAECIDSCEK
jgi:6-phosphogluconate dehydrogenase, decarboxylating